MHMTRKNERRHDAIIMSLPVTDSNMGHIKTGPSASVTSKMSPTLFIILSLKAKCTYINFNKVSQKKDSRTLPSIEKELT